MQRHAISLSLLCVAAIGGCGVGVSTGCPELRSESQQVARHGNGVALDLVLVIDSAPTAIEYLDQLSAAIATIVEPRCSSRSMPTTALHRCDPNNPDDIQTSIIAMDLRVGVVSADLGARGAGIASCDSARGDDGSIGPRAANPTRFPLGPGEASCEALPRFLSYCGTYYGCRSLEGRAEVVTANDAPTLQTQLACHLAATGRGCALGQPLEALWRALVEHGAAEPAGSGAPNAGFLRPDARLGIVVLSTGEDHSVRDCSHDGGFSATRGEGACRDGTSAFDRTATQWASVDVEQRFYLSEPNGPQDPTWNVARYLDPSRRWNRDLDSLKPGRPDRISFIAIAGAPTEIPRVRSTQGEPIDWATLSAGLSPTFDATCGHITAACQRGGAPVEPGRACRPHVSVALPSRRIVELARRFAESPRCNGAACRRGSVQSICASRFDDVVQWLREWSSLRLDETDSCLGEAVPVHVREDGLEQTSCVLREILPPGHRCDPSRGRTTPTLGPTAWTNDRGVVYSLCEIPEVPTFPRSAGALALRPAQRTLGWYLDRTIEPSNPMCTQRVFFTAGAQPSASASLRLICQRTIRDGLCRP